MISLDEIDKTILELEQRDTTYAVCEKLAWLYIVRSNLKSTATQAWTITAQSGDSEFLEALTNAETETLRKVLDEHFEVVKAVYPKEYNEVLRRLKNA